jgi:hypothetical protein
LEKDEREAMEIALKNGGIALIDICDAAQARYGWRRANREEYVVRVSGVRTLYLHREIMGVTDPKIEVDHRDGNKLDNRRSNLRVVTHAENLQNRKGLDRNNKSGYRGVHWDKRDRKWLAHTRLKGKLYHLGSFDDVHEAGRAASEFRAKHMPFSSDAAVARHRTDDGES